jgi:hypothetical protein
MGFGKAPNAKRPIWSGVKRPNVVHQADLGGTLRSWDISSSRRYDCLSSLGMTQVALTALTGVNGSSRTVDISPSAPSL